MSNFNNFTSIAIRLDISIKTGLDGQLRNYDSFLLEVPQFSH